ncbi:MULTISPECIES: hypothetical protein [Halomonadaceae]|uniref:Uncharacterized protein n=2 Tax=Vreelandella TaxID=3137766 RepID=A0A7Z0LSI5_9GAMM|nr:MULTISPECIES: hypothetical protein [Halomonas]NYS77798.1 hypothetical protein [Halomonas glaciei]|tara:strand:- start:2750 stop:2899 length:150 start_codon:yes stop_codon:yes gene_type:complete
MNQLMIDVEKDVKKQIYKQLVELGDDVKHLSMLAANRFPSSVQVLKKAS